MIHVGINLGGGNVGVTEHLLNASKVCAVLHEMSRKRMPEGVRGDVRLDSSLFGIIFDKLPEALSGHRLSGTVNEKSFFVFIVKHAFSCVVKLALNGGLGFVTERNDAFFGPVMADDKAHLHVNVLDS